MGVAPSFCFRTSDSGSTIFSWRSRRRFGFSMLGRLISGATAASFSTANAYISDITPPEKRAGRFGMIGAAFGLGFILGPALGGWLGNYDLRLPFWAAAALSLANALYGYFILPEVAFAGKADAEDRLAQRQCDGRVRLPTARARAFWDFRRNFPFLSRA